ncbi:winged helix-turn-helix transcriptional regulator [Rhodococcoides fascians]|uniref:winged helix-turn-helix transcriptional regulator n=1 Tax=Rhodococcoides fascians TaxID=1828 RepID=UPI00050C3282|nr:helix-turn-helix domain-containing protein [Rhodococcus fascians]
MRSYDQYCGLARSLEIVGDRWNLLVVRELLIGPARYRDLQIGLPGIATNLLAERLRHLEASGVIERRLAGDSNAVQYALTAWGAELRKPIDGLLRWSLPLMVSGPKVGDTFRPNWLALAIPALLENRVDARPSTAIGLEVGDELLQLCATESGFEVGLHDGRILEATVRADAAGLLGLAAGALTVDDAQALGLIDIRGDDSIVRTCFAG